MELKDWHVESGEFDIMIGHSSESIVLNDTIHVESTIVIKTIVDKNTMLGDILSNPQRAPIVQGLLQKMQEGMGGLGSTESLGEGAEEMFSAMMKYMPLRTLVAFGQGEFTEEMLNGIIQQLNNI